MAPDRWSSTLRCGVAAAYCFRTCGTCPMIRLLFAHLVNTVDARNVFTAMTILTRQKQHVNNLDSGEWLGHRHCHSRSSKCPANHSRRNPGVGGPSESRGIVASREPQRGVPYVRVAAQN